MTYLQNHLTETRVSRFKEFKATQSQLGERSSNPFSLEGMSEALSDIIALSASGICKMLKEKNRWPKLNSVVAVADFLDICPDMIFELARKDMRVEVQQGAAK